MLAAAILIAGAGSMGPRTMAAQEPAAAYGVDSLPAYDTTDLTVPEARFRRAGSVLRWNVVAREAAGRAGAGGTEAFYLGNNNTRLLALVHGAQYEALRAADAAAQTGIALRRTGARSTTPGTADPAAAGAAHAVLLKIFPADSVSLRRELESDRERLRRSDIDDRAIRTGESLGRAAAARWIVYAAEVLAAGRWSVTAPVGPGFWRSDGRAPGLAASALYRPWFLASPRALRAPPPPAYGSAEFEAALREVRQVTEQRTRDQTKATWAWARNAASLWSEIAGDMIIEHRLSDLAAARALAYLNMALSDATVACWDAKLAYWYIRPSQADSTIVLSVELPHFPAYPSGHATIFAAGAAVLAHFIPAGQTALDSIAAEVAMSRLWAGVHYRFDNEVGTEMGREVGRLAVAAARRERGTPIRPASR